MRAARKSKRQKVLEKFSHNSYEDRRRSFARASSAHKRKVEMQNVLEDLRKLPWGEEFLQVHTRNMHIYYSKDTACENDTRRWQLIGLFLDVSVKSS
ncbi:hypothetical protein ANCCAN_15575 [Ancylostoma caninum]|uniref:Uncharacterized protein n=1 Tax=Ancylostoma caninum TaxID=29170 RepID=A0A368G644_ANCCA|nr:hypothetical protein ANCCAN_15575 [Ancylostoma caninum]